jgi:hypothetical protein
VTMVFHWSGYGKRLSGHGKLSLAMLKVAKYMPNAHEQGKIHPGHCKSLPGHGNHLHGHGKSPPGHGNIICEHRTFLPGHGTCITEHGKLHQSMLGPL